MEPRDSAVAASATFGAGSFSAASLRAAYLDHVARLQEGYARLCEAEGLDAVVLHSGTPKSRTDFDDQFWPLRVIPHFAHWLPLGEPDCALVVRPGQRP